MPDQELALVTRAVAGDTRALEDVLRLWGPRVHRFARRLCPANEALDAVQETLLILADRIGTLKAAEALTSWSFQVVKRQCLKAFSLVRRETALAQYLGAFDDLSRPPDHDRRELLDELGRVLANLPERDRQILILLDLEGLSQHETGRRLGLSLPAVKSRVHRARTLLRRRMLASPLARTVGQW